MIARIVATLALVSACGRDVRLGTAVDAPSDVAADGNGNPFTAGSYAMTYEPGPQQMCEGTLVGNEAAFTTITAASLGFGDGTVTFATPTATTLRITGTPIATALGQASLDLMQNSLPDGVWDGVVTGDFSTGPLSTLRNATDLAADTTTANAATILAQVAVLFLTGDGMGQCTVLFGVAFTHS